MLKVLSGNIKKNEGEIKSSWMMYIYLHYFLFIWITDLINLVSLYIGIEQPIIVSHVLAILVVGLVCYLDNGKFEFQRNKINAIDIIVIVCILMLGLYKCVYPDTGYDTITYHMISQYPVWEGKESFYYYELSFPFADRLFYLFRYFLGYRLGTIFNAIILMMIYSQTKKLIKIILKKNNLKVENVKLDLIISVGAAAILVLEAVLLELGTYMTDIVAIPLMLEVLCFLIEAYEKDSIPIEEMIYVVICLTFIFLCKFVSSIVVVVYLFVYLIIVRKSVTLKRFFTCLAIAIGLVIPFITYNLYFSGEVLFEFSFVFQGYLGEGLDNRWGGENIIQKILWPIYMASYPSERHMEIISMPNYYPLFAIIFCIIEFIKGKKSVLSKEFKLLFIIIFTTFYLWVLSRGVDRYALINLIGFGIIWFCGGIIYLSYNKKIQMIIVGVIIIIQCMGSLWCIVGKNNSWQPASNLLIQILTGDTTYKKQIEWIGNDKGNIIENAEQYNVFFVPARYHSAWGKFINQDAKIYQVCNLSHLAEDKKNSYIEEIKKEFEKNDVYAACEGTDYEAMIAELNSYNMVITKMEYLDDTYVGDIVLMKVEYKEDKENELVSIGTETSNKYISYAGGENYNLEVNVMVSPFITWEDKNTEFQMYYFLEGEKNVIANLELEPGKIYSIIEEVNLSNLESTEIVDIYVDVSYNYGFGWNTILLNRVKESL